MPLRVRARLLDRQRRERLVRSRGAPGHGKDTDNSASESGWYAREPPDEKSIAATASRHIGGPLATPMRTNY